MFFSFWAGYFFHQSIVIKSNYSEKKDENISILQTRVDSIQSDLKAIKIQLSKIQSTFSQLKQDKNIYKNQDSTSSASVKNDKTPTQVPLSIPVQILNGCGINGLTQKMAQYLKSYGVKIYGTGNYKSFNVKNSFIISQRQIPDELKQIATLLGIPQKRIQKKRVRSKATYIIIIGKDYKHLNPFKK